MTPTFSNFTTGCTTWNLRRTNHLMYFPHPRDVSLFLKGKVVCPELVVLRNPPAARTAAFVPLLPQTSTFHTKENKCQSCVCPHVRHPLLNTLVSHVRGRLPFSIDTCGVAESPSCMHAMLSPWPLRYSAA